MSALKCLSWDLPIGVGPQESYDDVVRMALSLVDASAIHDLVPNIMYEVFVDGSDNNKYENDIKTTWAFAVIACDNDTFHYHGAMAGRVTCERSNPNYIGAICQNSVSAELSAMCWALCWALSKVLKSHGRGFRPRICFNYDSLLSGGVAFALWNCNGEPRLSAIIECLAMILETVAEVSHTHVKSYLGHPWNHLFDNCCASIRS